MGFPGGSDGKESDCNAGDLGLIPQFGRTPWTKEPGGLQSIRLKRVRHNGETNHTHTHTHRKYTKVTTINKLCSVLTLPSISAI